MLALPLHNEHKARVGIIQASVGRAVSERISSPARLGYGRLSGIHWQDSHRLSSASSLAFMAIHVQRIGS